MTHEISGHRALLTILFIDIVGSTEFFSKKDDDDVSAIYKDFLRTAIAIVENNGGFVNQSMGDGLMVVFGLEKDHEKHALMACRTAAELHAGFYNLNLRIGIHTGSAIVEKKELSAGPLITIAGKAVNIAAKIEKAARSGETLLSQDTLNLIKNQVRAKFRARHLFGNQVIKSYRFIAWEEKDRSSTKKARPFKDFFGRDFELAGLLHRWREFTGNGPEITLLVGTAGVGKSRLIDEFVMQVSSEAPSLHYSFLPSGTARSNFFKDMFRQSVALLADASLIKELDHDNALMKSAWQELQGLDAMEAAWRNLDYRTKINFKAATVWRVLGLLQRPAVIILEDIHWADQEVKIFFNARRGMEKIFILASTRDLDALAGFEGQPLFSQVLLHNFNENVSRILLEKWLGRSATLSIIKRNILTAAEGSPLFLYEMVTALVDGGQLTGRAGNFICMDKNVNFTVPTSLKSLVINRVQSFSAGLQTCIAAMAVIGLRFEKILLLEITGLSIQELNGYLEDLITHGLLRRENNIFGDYYYFSHALIHNGVYDGILKPQRLELHRKILVTLKLRPHSRRAGNIALLAHHAFQANLHAQAFGYNYFAGKQALEQGEGVDAVEYYQHACHALENLPADFKSKNRYLVKCKLGLATALSIQNQHGKAKEIMDEINQQLHTFHDENFKLKNKLQSLELFDCWAQGALSKGVALGYFFIDKLDLYSDPDNYVTTAIRLGGMLQDQGHYIESNKILMPLKDFFRADDQMRYGLLFPPAAACFALIARNFGELGDFIQAKVFFEISLIFAENSKNMLSKIYVLADGPTYLVREKNFTEAISFFQDAYELAAQIKTNLLYPFAAVYYGFCLFNIGKKKEGVAIMEEGWQIAQSGNLASRQSLYAGMLAEAKFLEQDYAAAKKWALTAISIGEKYDERAHIARGYYIAGLAEYHLLTGDRRTAISLLETAQDMANSLSLSPLMQDCRGALTAIEMI